MTDRTPMRLDAEKLLDPVAMKNGPMDFLWNQDEWIPPNGPMTVGDKWPKRKPHQIILRCVRWHGTIRIAPPPDADLSEWGKAIAERLGVPWAGEPEEGDRAVWLPLTIWARNASHALGSAALVFQALDGFQVSQAAIRVQKAQP
jgi:hypothetical protein